MFAVAPFNNYSKNPITEYQSQFHQSCCCSQTATKVKTYSSALFPLLEKVAVHALEGAAVGAMIAIFGAQTTVVNHETEIIKSMIGIQTTSAGILTLISAVGIVGFTTWADGETNTRTKAAFYAMAATSLAAIVGTKVFETAAVISDFGALFFMGIGIFLTGSMIAIHSSEKAKGIAIATAIFIGGFSSLYGTYETAKKGILPIVSLGAQIGGVLSIATRVLRIFMTNEASNAYLNFQDAKSRIARAPYFPFFKTLLENYLNTLPSYEDCIAFLYNYKRNNQEALLQFATSYARQLLAIEALTVENVPDFFYQRDLIIDDLAVPFLTLINRLQQKIRNQSLSREEIARAVQQIAECLISLTERDARGRISYLAMPNAEEIEQIENLYPPLSDPLILII